MNVLKSQNVYPTVFKMGAPLARDPCFLFNTSQRASLARWYSEALRRMPSPMRAFCFHSLRGKIMVSEWQKPAELPNTASLTKVTPAAHQSDVSHTHILNTTDPCTGTAACSTHAPDMRPGILTKLPHHDRPSTPSITPPPLPHAYAYRQHPPPRPPRPPFAPPPRVPSKPSPAQGGLV